MIVDRELNLAEDSLAVSAKAESLKETLILNSFDDDSTPSRPKSSIDDIETIQRPIAAILPFIEPHELAPLFNASDAHLVLAQVLTEASSGNFPTDEDFRQLIRQASLVNLWFFLRVVASFSGPFDKLTPHLHMAMCNFWQKVTIPGGRGGMFIPRSHFKTTCTTEGGNAHRMLRNPNIRLRISAATYERAQQFGHTIKTIFDSNSFFSWLFPEYVPVKNQKRWNDKEIVLPNRTKAFREPTLYCGGAGGSSEGMHFDGHTLDDPFGEKTLNAMRASSSEMENVRNWVWTNLPSLLVSPQSSWSFDVGTRYAIDDLHGDIISRAKSVEGFDMPNFEVNPKGQWQVYYRQAVENGQIIFPENFSQEDFDQIALDDWWTWATQYENNPHASGLAEFTDFELRTCTTDLIHDEWWVIWRDFDLEGTPIEAKYPLSEFDVIMAVDPAATDHYVSARTSRSAVGIIATHWSGKVFLIDLRADYVDTPKMFDWMFSFAKKYGGHLRCTFLEQNGGFKVLSPILRREQTRRGVWLNLRSFAASTDKTVRIRAELSPIFEKKELFVGEAFEAKVNEEAMAFPQSSKKDILDMLATGVKNRIQPISPSEVAFEQSQKEAWRSRTTNLAGY